MVEYGKIYVNDKAVNVTNAKTNLLGANQNRRAWMVTNLDAALVVSISRGNTPTTSSGIVLQPKETYYETEDSYLPCWKGEVGAITTAAGPAALAVSETIVVDQIKSYWGRD